jgi:methylated-DNA-[protein]-cysteine S-methyltransferase
MNSKAYYRCPLGWVEIQTSHDAVSSVRLCKEDTADLQIQSNSIRNDSAILTECIRQLEEYFSGQRTNFDLPILQHGTEFQQSVWNVLETIPFGKTVNYAEVAKRINAPKAVRAVGAACGKNKVWIIVPCHRVIGADGSLTGYAGGLECKKWLLDHEAKVFLKIFHIFAPLSIKRICLRQ